MMLPWFLEPAILVDPQTLVITFPSVLPHHPPFIITATISLVPTALGACLCNWTEGERCEQPHSLTVFDRVNLSKLAVFSFFFPTCPVRLESPLVIFFSQVLVIRKQLLIFSEELILVHISVGLCVGYEANTPAEQPSEGL